MVAGQLAAPGQELQQLGLQQLQLARHQKGHDGGGLVEVGEPHVLQAEVHQLRHAGVQGEDGGLGDQGGVDVDPQTGGGVVPGLGVAWLVETLASPGGGDVDGSLAAAQVYEEVVLAQEELCQDQIYGSLEKGIEEEEQEKEEQEQEEEEREEERGPGNLQVVKGNREILRKIDTEWTVKGQILVKMV